MWICQKCNTQNTSKFCMDCGTSVNEQTADDLPPTVIGVMPPIMPPDQSNFAPQTPVYQPPVSVAPQKSGFSKLLIFGGISGLIVVAALGVVAYIFVVTPYLNQRREADNQSKADLLSAEQLLPDTFTSESKNYNRGESLNKYDMLKLSEGLPPELKAQTKDVTDAAAAVYSDGNQKSTLQIFRFNSPEQAKNACSKIVFKIMEIDKNNSYFSINPVRENHCEGGTRNSGSGYAKVTSLYGFLFISTGKNDYGQALSLHVLRKLTRDETANFIY